VSSRRKSYGVAEAVITSNPDLDPIRVRFDDQPGRPAQAFDFAEFADFPHLYRHIATAFDRHCGAWPEELIFVS
jgi:Fe-S-cluster formation regulator IscX/YfhJ